MTLKIFLIVNFFAAVGVAIFLTLRKRREQEQAFDELFNPVAGAGVPVRAAGAVPTDLGTAFNNALAALAGNPWPLDVLKAHLTGLRIAVRPEASWVDCADRRVAGLAYPGTKTIEVGSDLAALAHEMAEIVYTELTGQEDFQARTWEGREALEQGIARYSRGVQ